MNINNLIKIIIKEIWNYCDLQKYSVFNLFKSNKCSNHDFVAVVIIPIAVDLSIHILLTGIFLRFLFEIYKRKMGKTNSQNSYIDNGSDDVSEWAVGYYCEKAIIAKKKVWLSVRTVITANFI